MCILKLDDWRLLFYFVNIFKDLFFFIWLCQFLATACRLFSSGMWDVFLQTGVESDPPAWGAQALTTGLPESVKGKC